MGECHTNLSHDGMGGVRENPQPDKLFHHHELLKNACRSKLLIFLKVILLVEMDPFHKS